MIELAMPDLGPRERRRAVRGLRIFPVRHHSPLSSRILVESFRARPPRAVLIEGPSDADAFLPLIADAASRPPLALLSFRAGEQRAFYLDPFAEFSPEYQAIVLAREAGVPAHFCDLPLSCMGDRPQIEKLPAPGVELTPLQRVVCSMELWEAEFEARALSVDEYMEATLMLGREIARDRCDKDGWTAIREAHMMARAAKLVEGGMDPADILVVCGAAHAGPLIDAGMDLACLDRLSAPQKVSAFLVPYSYARLSCVTGYGAGLPYPGFAQAIWEASGDVEGAVCRILTEVAGQLARQGYSPSLADAIDGLTLAKNLAALRQRAAPGVPELVQAVEACLTRGTYARAADAVHRCLVGDRVGALAAQAGRAPLAVEFYGFVSHERYSPPLLISDRPLTRTLDLHTEPHREVSVFLHRCRSARIPYATPAGESGTWQESWRLQWGPDLDHRLAEACEEGLTIEEVAAKHARALLEAAGTVSDAAGVFVLAVRAGLATLIDEARHTVDARCTSCDDAPALCDAAARLHVLVRYEGLPPDLVAPIRGLFESVVARTLLVVGGLTALADEEAEAVATGLSRIVDVRPALAPEQQVLLDALLVELLASRDAHPLLAGTAAGLALLCGKVAMPRIAQEVAGRMCGFGTEGAAMHFLDGLFRNQRRELVATRDLVRELRAFVDRLPEDEFFRLLPALRRTFGRLEDAERTVLFSNLVRCGPRAVAPAAPPGARRGVRAGREMTRALDRLTRRLLGEVKS